MRPGSYRLILLLAKVVVSWLVLLKMPSRGSGILSLCDERCAAVVKR